MAECAVSFVLEKLTSLLDEKVNLISDVKQEVEYVRDELERMTAFLRVADAAEDTDPELRVWVKQVRDVAYETEDIIDEFMIKLHYTNGCIPPPCCVYKLKPLSDEESWILFCHKAFQGNQCPSHLVEICKRILRRCDELPLAIVAISGVLLTKKDTNIDEWKMLNSSLGSELEANDQLESMRNILLLSFNYMPHYLKPCFMYLSGYPEDHLIEHNTLIRQLIAEGLVKQKDGRTIEEVAQGYLNELVNRSLIHPMRMNDDGSVKESCIHGFYREIILSKSRDQNFVTTSVEENMVWPKRVRRLSIHGRLEASDIERYGARLCSILSFGSNDSQSASTIVKLLKRCRMLKVLDMRGVPLKNYPEAISRLFHLKYLCLRDSGIKTLPESIKNLQKLEMLDLKETYITELPIGILKLIRLRHLLVYHHVPGSYMDYNYVNGFKALKGMGNWKLLQKLCFIEASPGSNILKEIAEMNELKRLSITMIRTEDCEILSSSIGKLGKLCSLGVRAVEGDFLDLHYLSSPPPFLQRLYMGGRLRTFPLWIQRLHSLVKVYLRWSRLSDDPLEHLQDLPNIVHIEFLDAYIGQQLCFKTGKFKKLKLLGLERLERLKEVVIEEGSASCLEKFIIQRCKMLGSVPVGIERLMNLKFLEFFDMPEEFIRTISPGKHGDEYWKVARIPEVYHTYWRNGCWEVHLLEGEGQKPGDESGKQGSSVVRTQERRNWL